MKTLSDFERVLMNIAIETEGKVYDSIERIPSGGHLRFRFGKPAPQFIPIEIAKAIDVPLEKGDIVRCQTNPNHRWGISVFVKQRGYSDWTLQEIGGKALLNMDNEGLDVLRFISSSKLYTGHQHQVYLWAHKAFSKRYNKDADHFKRCGGVEFDGDQLIIWCRSHIWTMEMKGENGETLYAQPKKFTLQWGKWTRMKDIVSAMKEQGFGSEFEFAPEKPTNGQAGYTTFIKK